MQPTGSGNIDSFLRVQDAGGNLESQVVDGMNTDGTLLNDEKEGPSGGKNFTHDVATADLSVVQLDTNGDGTQENYYKFLLDINQEGGDPLLTLSGLQLCQSQDASLSFVDTCADGGATSTLKYDMQSPTGNPALLGDTVHEQTEAPKNTVLLDYKLNSGSGSGDMWVYIPTSVLPDNPAANKQLYLWSQFGAPNSQTVFPAGSSCATLTTVAGCDANNNDGYEEWAFLSEGPGNGGFTPSDVPEPGSLVLLGTGLLFGGHLIRRRSRKPSKAE